MNQRLSSPSLTTYRMEVHLHASFVEIRPHPTKPDIVCRWEQRIDESICPAARSFVLSFLRERQQTDTAYARFKSPLRWTHSPQLFQTLIEASDEGAALYEGVQAFWEDTFCWHIPFYEARDLQTIINWQWAKYWLCDGLPPGLYGYTERVDLTRDDLTYIPR